nr:MAG TPA: hypothetical protein [Caudoviricetes sp.]
MKHVNKITRLGDLLCQMPKLNHNYVFINC